MTLPSDFSKRHYCWQSGYLAGLWKPNPKKGDVVPPTNPIVKDNPAWHEWNEGFRQAQRDQEKGEQK